MKRLDLVYHQKLGIAMVVDLVSQQDHSMGIVAYADDDTDVLRFGIVSDEDVVNIRVSAPLEGLRKMLQALEPAR